MLIRTAHFELEVHRWLLFVRLGRRCVCLRRDEYGWLFSA